MIATNYKHLIIIVVLFSSFIISYGSSFNVCNVNINEPQFEVKNSKGNSIVIVDDQGDVFMQGRDHSQNNKNSYESLEIGLMHFNNKTSKFSNFTANSNDYMTNNALLIKNSLNQTVASFSGDSIVSKGSGIYQGSQAQCAPDGYYCSGGVKENRNYYCDIDGDNSGDCRYNIVNSENCLTKPTDESHSGVDYLNSGFVQDYVGCSSGNCESIQHHDVCQSSDSLKEFSALGSSYEINIKSCSDYNYRYCVGDNKVNKKTFSCSDGECGLKSDNLVKYCSTSPDEYSSWSCVDSNTKVRTITQFSPTCSTGSCDEISTTTQETQNCDGEKVCSGGECITEDLSIELREKVVNSMTTHDDDIIVSGQNMIEFTYMGDTSYFPDTSFFSKYDTLGNKLLEKTLGNVYIENIETDSNGNIFVVGLTKSDRRWYTAKFDKNGNKLWERNYDSSNKYWSGDRVNSLVVDSNDDIIVAGLINPQRYASNIRVMKYSNSGSTKWSKNFDFRKYDYVGDINKDSNDNLYVTGYYGGDNPYFDIFIRKLNKNGNTIWHEQYNYDEWEKALSIDFDSNDNFYVGGYKHPSGLEHLSDSKSFVLKYDKNGNRKWSRARKGRGNDLKVFDETIYAASGRYNNDNLLRYDTSGNLVSTETGDNGKAIAINSDGVVYMASGTYEKTTIKNYN